MAISSRSNLRSMLHFLFQTDDVVPDQVGEVIDAAKTDPVLAAALIAAGVATLALFVWGLSKQLFKAALFAGAASAGVWYWYFNIK